MNCGGNSSLPSRAIGASSSFSGFLVATTGGFACRTMMGIRPYSLPAVLRSSPPAGSGRSEGTSLRGHDLWPRMSMSRCRAEPAVSPTRR
jgi:hypothetical protein